jgi:hypothetical protein
MLRVIRKLCLRGNAYYICVPKAMVAAMKWPADAPLTVEVIGPGAIRVRAADISDMSTAQILPMTISLPREAAK